MILPMCPLVNKVCSNSGATYIINEIITKNNLNIVTQPKKADCSYNNNYSDTIVNRYSITVKIMLFHTIVNTLITVVVL